MVRGARLHCTQGVAPSVVSDVISAEATCMVRGARLHCTQGAAPSVVRDVISAEAAVMVRGARLHWKQWETSVLGGSSEC
jgi:hypothetical protein